MTCKMYFVCDGCGITAHPMDAKLPPDWSYYELLLGPAISAPKDLHLCTSCAQQIFSKATAILTAPTDKTRDRRADE